MRSRVSLALLLAACSIGPTTKSYPPANGPAGATVTVELHDDRAIGGELLAVEDSSLLLVEKRQLIRLGIASVRVLKGPRLSTSGRELSERVRERLRLISRYPQGVSPELEARLLHAYGASAVRRIP
jgi:hypothetical protein